MKIITVGRPGRGQPVHRERGQDAVPWGTFGTCPRSPTGERGYGRGHVPNVPHGTVSTFRLSLFRDSDEPFGVAP
jgi:hypothetical protein